MTTVQITRRVGNAAVKLEDATGGVFVPDAARGLSRPIYSYGAPGAKTLDPVFSCPVSAIAPEYWQLLEIWFTSRALGGLPVGSRADGRAAGTIDQPVSVLRSFPIFEAEQRAIESQRDASRHATGIASALANAFRGRR